MTREKPDRRHLYSLYQRVKGAEDEKGKKMCCEEWRNNSKSFYTWYVNQHKKQKGVCEYCHMPGDTTKSYRAEGFRKGRRGFHLEVDRKDAKGEYSPDNCVLACIHATTQKVTFFHTGNSRKLGKL
jgi:hypothetical protein